MIDNLDELAQSMLKSTPKTMSSKTAESILRGSQNDKILSIKESIADIEAQMLQRTELSQDQQKSIDKIINSVDKIIAEVDAYGKGVIEYTDIRKEMLKKKFDLLQAKSQEQLNLWKDVSLLKKELREHLKELREIESKGNMLDDLLEL